MSCCTDGRKEEFRSDGPDRRDSIAETIEPESVSRFSAWYTASVEETSFHDMFAHGLFPAPYRVSPVGNVMMAGTSSEFIPSTPVMPFINATFNTHANKNNDFIGFPGIIKNIRILGFMAIISYMVVILFTWIYANLEGYVYFSAGEPLLIIKYPEWVLGFIGITVAVDSLRKELN